MKDSRKRYIGLDVHKHYLIAVGVDDELNVVLPVRRVELSRLEAWMQKTLTKQDQVVLEMTTNTWQLYDELCQYAGSVLVVHPPQVALITRSQVMNDKIAASILARLLAKGLLVGIWIPPQEIREARGCLTRHGPTPQDGATGHTGEEPPACRDPTPSPGSACRPSVRSAPPSLVAVFADREAGKAQSTKRSGNPAVCRAAK